MMMPAPQAPPSCARTRRELKAAERSAYADEALYASAGRRVALQSGKSKMQLNLQHVATTFEKRYGATRQIAIELQLRVLASDTWRNGGAS